MTLAVRGKVGSATGNKPKRVCPRGAAFEGRTLYACLGVAVAVASSAAMRKSGGKRIIL